MVYSAGIKLSVSCMICGEKGILITYWLYASMKDILRCYLMKSFLQRYMASKKCTREEIRYPVRINISSLHVYKLHFVMAEYFFNTIVEIDIFNRN